MEKNIRIKYALELTKHIDGFSLSMFFSVLINLLFKISPLVIGVIISYMINSAIIGDDSLIGILFVFVIIMVIFDAVLSYLDILVSHDMAYKILTKLRKAAYDKIDEIAPAAMENNRSGDLISTIISDIELLEWFYAHTITQIIVAVIISLTSLIFMGIFSWILPLTLLPFIALLIYFASKKSKEADKQGGEVRASTGELNSVIIDGVQGIKDIIIFQFCEKYFSMFRNVTQKHNKSNFSYSMRSADENRKFVLIVSIGAIINNVAVILLVMNGRLNASWIIPLFVMSAAIFSPIQEALAMSTNYGLISGASKRLFNLFQMKSYVKDTGIKNFKDLSLDNKYKAIISFDKVTFCYPSASDLQNEILFNDLSFDIKKGEKIAIVGKSGSGKSTAAKLIQRFWDIDSGKIKIGGVNIKDIPLHLLRSLVTVVSQDTYLFNQSIRDNLLLAKSDASEIEVEAAIHNARAYDFIKIMPEGLDTIVGERGFRLSGGEKQRISIAQALLKNSPILIFDEASANLDSDNENLINQSINMFKSEKTTIVISHRLSTIRDADRIIVIRDGSVECVGTYDDLINSSKYFRDLTGSCEYA